MDEQTKMNRRLFLSRAVQGAIALSTLPVGGSTLLRLIESAEAASPMNPVTAPKLMNIHFWGGVDFFYLTNGVPISLLNDSDCPTTPNAGGRPNCAIDYSVIRENRNFGPFGAQNHYTPRYQEEAVVANPHQSNTPFGPYMAPLADHAKRMAFIQCNGSVHNLGNYLMHAGTQVTNMPTFPALVAKASADRFGRALPYDFIGGSYGARYGDPNSEMALSAQPIQIGADNFQTVLAAVSAVSPKDLDVTRRGMLDYALRMIQRETMKELNRKSDKDLFSLYQAQYQNSRNLMKLGIAAETDKITNELIVAARQRLPEALHGEASIVHHSRQFALATVVFSKGLCSVYDYGAMGNGSDPHHSVEPHAREIQIFGATFAAFRDRLAATPAGEGKSVLDTVNFVLASEMGRSPQIQSQIGEGDLGTQHFPHSCSVVLMGPNVKPGYYGGFKLARRDSGFSKIGNFSPLPIDTQGRPAKNGRTPDLADIYQTVLRMFNASKYAAITVKGVTWDF